jgi:predicted glycosyltransferase
MATRSEILTRCVRDLHPDVVLTELYPFGRRVLAGEFQQTLAAARALSPRPLICASIRDILAPPSKPEKVQATADVISEFYDTVLVHSDPALVPLDQSWPVTPEIAAKIRYTGFVAPAPAGPHPEGLGQDDILVTAGGGDVGQRLFDTALLAAGETPDQHWRLLVGGGEANARREHLKAKAPENCVITPPTPDFRQMLYHTRACVSYCGYNTALDILQAGTPAVFVPFDAGGETEQSLRAKALSTLPGIEVVTSTDLGATSLIGALEKVRQSGRRSSGKYDFTGAQRTVDIVTDLSKEPRA